MNVIETTSVFLTGAGQLVLRIPADSYFNCRNYAIRIAQALPTVTAANSVAIQIGANADVYPVIRRCGHYLYADQIMRNRIYLLKVAADSGQFLLLSGNLLKYNPGQEALLPITEDN